VQKEEKRGGGLKKKGEGGGGGTWLNMIGQVINQLHIRDNGSMRPAVCEYICQHIQSIHMYSHIDRHAYNSIICVHIPHNCIMRPVVYVCLYKPMYIM